MSTQVWLPKDAEQLKELREAAQTDISILARMYSLSITQIKQLEDGGESSFYSPAIKYATGRKLLMHFGVDITEIKEKGDRKEFDSLNTPKDIFIKNEIKESYKFFRWGLLTKILLFLLCVLFLVNSFSDLKNIASKIFFADNQLLSPVVKIQLKFPLN
jgi:transcriptional regulator with XRE-family HTH domain